MFNVKALLFCCKSFKNVQIKMNESCFEMNADAADNQEKINISKKT